MTNQEIAQEAVRRTREERSMANYPAIFEGFMSKGIDESDIIPRENVLTFGAWRALGRCVEKGQHGVRVLTWIPITKKGTGVDGKDKAFMRPKNTTVFHISQTKEL